MNLQNILVFRIGHLGDTVIALPALWAIRENYPNAKITLLTNIDVGNPNYVSPRHVLPDQGLIDETIAYPTNLGGLRRTAALAALIATLRWRKFDGLIYLMPRIRASRQIDRDHTFFRMAGIDRVLGAEYIRQNALTLPIAKPTPTIERETDFMLDVLASEGLTVDRDNLKTDLLLTKAEQDTARSWLENRAGDAHHGKRLIAIAPGSKWRSKVWHEDRFAAVADRLASGSSCYPIVFGGPEDKDVGDRLIERWKTGSNAAGYLSIRESAALLEKCELYLGNDTGTMHLAAAVGTPCVATFAAIDWIGRWTPVGADSVVFRKSVVCEGCLTPECFNAHKCLDLIGVDEVHAACAEMLDR